MSSPADDELLQALQQLGRLMSSRTVASRLASAAGVELTQQSVRIVRALHRAGRVPMARLSAESEMDVGAVSRQVKTLERDGLVLRAPSEDDQRVVLVDLTARGVRVAKELRRVGRRHLEASLEGWSDTDRRRAAQLLSRLVGDLRRTAIDAPRRRD